MKNNKKSTLSNKAKAIATLFGGSLGLGAYELLHTHTISGLTLIPLLIALFLIMASMVSQDLKEFKDIHTSEVDEK